MRRPLRKPHGLNTSDIENFESTAEYVIYLDGADYVAINGDTGVEDSRSISAHTVIQYAITNTTRGVVRLKTDVTMTAGVTGKENVVLDCGMHVLSPATSFTMVTMKPGFQIRDFVFDVSAIVFTHTCIYFDGADQYDYPVVGIDLNTMVANGRARSADQSGRFMWLDCDAANEWILTITVRDIFTFRFEYAYYLEASLNAATNYINENVFNVLKSDGDAYFIFMNRAAAAKINGNEFTGISYQRRVGTVDAITVNGDENYFQGRIWDIAGGEKAVVFDATSNENLVMLQKTAGTYITYAGTNNQVFLTSEQGYTGLTDFKFFNGSGGNKFLYIYGDDAGTDKYVRLRVTSEGSGVIQSSAGEVMQVISDTSINLNPAADGDVKAFHLSATGENQIFSVHGRDAGDANTRNISLRWGDGTLDHGIVSTNNGDLYLAPATGVVRFGTKTGTGDAVLDGYVTIKDAAGNTVKLATTA